MILNTLKTFFSYKNTNFLLDGKCSTAHEKLCSVKTFINIICFSKTEQDLSSTAQHV